ncbi:high affinity immunoglobulin epsilon receptor subunit alpha [Hyaena hyaena]|uniref:high affinity immunoglobulin epsilon receptor subunit alpha n=1 Tax=Hyaena hyaena TaxID=95912 RepID=UPI0019248F76|nr:high affinity immunoglobulin epsilon receptor subunit alpha [Hyaena hyaena]
MPVFLGSPALLWTALLLLYPGGMSADIRQSTVSLNPPWTTILEVDNVTLTCKVNNSLELSSTVWFHNKTLLGVTTSHLDIVKAQAQDSGEYRCRNKGSILSKPVYLKVLREWLLLQVSPEVVMEGESFLIRCHGWKNRDVRKVTYYRNGKALKYWYENHNISFNNATVRDSGTYYCTGLIWKINHTSNFLNIAVTKDFPTELESKYYWLQFVIPLLVVILFAVDTGLFILTQQQLKLLLKMKRTRKGKNLMDPRRKPDPKIN